MRLSCCCFLLVLVATNEEGHVLFVQNIRNCGTIRSPRTLGQGLIHLYKVSVPFEGSAIDTIGQFLESQTGNRHILLPSATFLVEKIYTPFH